MKTPEKSPEPRMDYSDELLDLKWMHEYNQSRTFTDDEFNEIFETALKKNPGLFKQAEKLIEHVVGMLITLEEATTDWEENLLKRVNPDAAYAAIQGSIANLRRVINHYANAPKPDWATVGTLANIHQRLGETIYEKYDRHLGYSRSVEDGIKRHAEASRHLLEQAVEEVNSIDREKHLPDLLRWKKFFDELMEGFQGALLKIKSDEELTPEIRKKLEEIFAVSQSHAISAWVSELLDRKREITEEELKKIDERYKVVERLKRELKFDEEEETPEAKLKQEEIKPAKQPSLKEEAIELARKLGDEELIKYLQKAPLKAIQRRIKALREEAALQKIKIPHSVGKRLSKQEQKKFRKTYKYVSDNPAVITAGTKVLDKNGSERIIAETSDKTLRLEGENNWIGISEVRFRD